MAVVIEAGPAGASASAGLDELISELQEAYAAPSPRIRRAGELGRPCRCDRPIRNPDAQYPSWIRCLKCGRDT